MNKVIVKNKKGFDVKYVDDNYILKSNETKESLEGFLKPDIVDSKVIETATVKEITDYKNQKAFAKFENFIKNNEEKGQEFYKSVRTKITMQLYKRPQQEVNPIVAEIDTAIVPILDKINSGDWYSAITLQVNNPTIDEVLSIYNEVLTFARNYVQENY